mmetsp:Transcript_24784/g.53899  ORF Transcript_24784/g.53899 Transcript_24784/m.53899 type:complete len:354 (+) Transcript_24784:171-1232(+)
MKMAAKMIKVTVVALAAQACSTSPSCAVEDRTCSSARQGIEAESEGSVQLLQTGATRRAEAKSHEQKLEEEQEGQLKKEELVLAHIPFNFGHTVEKVALFGSGADTLGQYRLVMSEFNTPITPEQRWNTINRLKRPNSVVWGHMNPDLGTKSPVTGCPMYYTPQKFWPQDLAEAYFGNKTVFGILRDPYERLVSIFRGNYVGYGGFRPELFATCDVDGAVQQMMKDYLAGNKYGGGCTFVPQAEYFENPHGITLAVDNRLFPQSMNDVFDAHGYHQFQITEQDILHVDGCPNVWAGDLSCETKAMVRQVYKADFELLCEKFGYCTEENTCIKGVPNMCPKDLASKEKTATHCS